MIQSNTVFVLGAGASIPYKFKSGSQMFTEARALSARQLSKILGVYEPEAERFQRVLAHSLGESIDSVLETRADVSNVGKRYIAREIAAMERYSKEHPPSIEEDWIALLFQEMTRGSALEDLTANPVAFVTFNYDRLLEYRLCQGLISRYGNRFSDDHCYQVLRRVPIVHLHGDIGELGDGGTGDFLPFGYEMDPERNSSALGIGQKRIRIVHEGNIDTPEFKRAHELLAIAEQVVFIGFGFGEENLARLLSSKWKDGVRVFGTCTLQPSRYDYQVTRPFEKASLKFSKIGDSCRHALDNHLHIFRERVT